MKWIQRSLLLAGIAASCAYAAPPSVMHYQGRVLDSLGNPANETATVLVRLFTVETDGTAAWEQNLDDVAISNGLYSIEFGDAGLPSVLTNTAVWLEVTVNGETLAPRNRLVSVPYALRAAVAEELEGALPGLPSGAIAMWSGSVATVPEGWVLCDGENGAPDLRDRFVMGVAAGQDPGATGGGNSLTLTIGQMPAHTHTATAASAGSHTHTGSGASAGNHTHNGTTGSGGSHNHTVLGDNSTGSQLNGPIGSAAGGTSGSFNSPSQNHTHTVASLSSGGAHTHTVTLGSDGNHSHTVSVDSTGDGEPIDKRPAFYAMAFIYKL